MHISRPGCFGKIPRQGDFVRHLADPLAAAGLDRWLQDGLALAPRDAGPRAEVHAFRFVVVRDSAALLGVAAPSRDRVGRQFPLLVFVVIGDVPDLAWLAPLVARDFLRAAQDIADVAARGVLDLSALRQHVDSLHFTAAIDEARAQLERHLQATSLRTFAAPAVPDGDPKSLAAWFTNLALAVGGGERPRYSVRCTGSDDPLWLAAWLRLATAAANRRSPRLILWDRAEGGGASAVRLLYDEPVARYAASMLFAAIDHELAFDVRPQALPGAGAAPARVATTLLDPDRALHALVAEWGG